MYQEIVRPNGARLLLEEVPGARSAALGFFVGAGSRHETAAENGSAHFIEHMLFKGTHRRSAADLAVDMDAIGGQVNAYTTKENTSFYARSLDRHLDRALDILSDMLFCSRFDQSDVETERGVILEEIGMYEDTPEDLVAERLSAAVYKGTALARPILGTEATLSAMTGDSLRRWQKEHYLAGNMVAALAGSFTCAQVDKILAGNAPAEIKDRAKVAKFDERLALLGLLLDGITEKLRAVCLTEKGITELLGALKNVKLELTRPGANGETALQKQIQTEI